MPPTQTAPDAHGRRRRHRDTACRAGPHKRTRDIEHRFRQDSDFYYLTGFAEPDAVAVLAPGRKNGEYLLFCRDRDKEKERWDGSRAGPDGAVELHGADDAFPIDDIDDILPGIIESCTRVYYTMGMYADFDARITDWVNSLRSRGNHAACTRRRNSLRSITCCMTCGCTRVARKCRRCARPPRLP